ncbi:MAG: hypothetical protein B7C24_06155 [Bacteroidetes bacterium 4572_77]|nr:MAG: hypothetical protein B7C24_06155 [Bacteroidetes bacterium 4572_77]
MNKKRLFLSLFTILNLFLFAQAPKDSYKIEIKIKGSTDSVIYLANYYGDKTYLADTAYSNGKGNYTFQKDEELQGGLYIAVDQQKHTLFEFLVSDSRNIKLETNKENYIANMKINGSDENQRFFDYLRFSGDLYKNVKPFNDKLRSLDKDSDSISFYRNKIQSINKEMMDYKENYMETYPNSFLSNFFGLIKDPAIPDTLISLADGSKDSSYPYRYYKAHYWDYVDLSDNKLIRTPIYHTKLDNFFEKAVGNNADTIIHYTDFLLNQMDETGDLYKFTLWHLTIKYDESKIMGHDAVLVYFSDNYFSKGKAAWLDETVVENILTEADKRRSTLIGQPAPNLIMLDTNLQAENLYEIPSDFTVMFFWDPSCGHCKDEIPKLVDFYNNYTDSLDVQVFAVCTDTNMKKMKKYIKKRNMNFINVNGPRAYTADYHDLYNIFSTPVMIVLDRDKTIIAKRLMSEQLPEFISNHIKYFQDNTKK